MARELREDLWNRFKEASTVINKKHQAYFDELHKKEQENLTQKQALIQELHDKLDNLKNEEGEYTIKSNKQWEELTAAVQDVQTRWRAIGFAPRKYNQSVYDEYRALTDGFFRAKTRFYKNIRDQFSENLKAKRDLLKQAEELLNGEQTPEATEQMIQLQKTWKTIGPVARKYSDEIWKQFTDTCDAFFNRKRETERQERGERQRERGERIMQSGDKNKLSRMYEQLQQEIKTAENNILFFTGKSKSASKLVQDMQKKIDALKAQLKTLEEKLNAE